MAPEVLAVVMMMLLMMRLKIRKPVYGPWLLCLMLIFLTSGFYLCLGLGPERSERSESSESSERSEIPTSHTGRSHSKKLTTSASRSLLAYQKTYQKTHPTHKQHKQNIVSDKDDQSPQLRSSPVTSATGFSSLTHTVLVSSLVGVSSIPSASSQSSRSLALSSDLKVQGFRSWRLVSGTSAGHHSQREAIKEAHKKESSLAEILQDGTSLQALHHRRAEAELPCCWQPSHGGGSHYFGACQAWLWNCPIPLNSRRLFAISGLEVSDLGKDLGFFYVLKRLPRYFGTEVFSELSQSSESAFFSDQPGALMISLIKHLGTAKALGASSLASPAFSLRLHSSF